MRADFKRRLLRILVHGTLLGVILALTRLASTCAAAHIRVRHATIARCKALPPHPSLDSEGGQGASKSPKVCTSGRRSLLLSSGHAWAAGTVSGLSLPHPWEDSRHGSSAWAFSRTPEERQAAKIFEDSTPGVVAVARGRRPGERRRRDFSDIDGLPPAIGSGFVWDADHVVTNYHVVKDERDLLVIFISEPSRMASGDPPRRDMVKAQLVGIDSANDIAVLRVARPADEKALRFGMKPLARGESAALDVGQTVFAIGNPFGLDHSMSRGIISGISRILDVGQRPIRGCIQTDASINPGNSGGPLLDSQGQVIGVNTLILSASGTSAGVGLAVPIDSVKKSVEAIIRTGFVNRPFLGITFAPDEVSDQLQLPGIIVMAVVAGSPAQKAGVKPMRKGTLGDVVTSVDGESVRTGRDFFRLIDKHVPGDNVTFKVERAQRGLDDGVEELSFNATLASIRSTP